MYQPRKERSNGTIWVALILGVGLLGCFEGIQGKPRRFPTGTDQVAPPPATTAPAADDPIPGELAPAGCDVVSYARSQLHLMALPGAVRATIPAIVVAGEPDTAPYVNVWDEERHNGTPRRLEPGVHEWSAEPGRRCYQFDSEAIVGGVLYQCDRDRKCVGVPPVPPRTNPPQACVITDPPLPACVWSVDRCEWECPTECPEGEVLGPNGKCVGFCKLFPQDPTCKPEPCEPEGDPPGDACEWSEELCDWKCLTCDTLNPPRIELLDGCHKPVGDADRYASATVRVCNFQADLFLKARHGNTTWVKDKAPADVACEEGCEDFFLQWNGGGHTQTVDWWVEVHPKPEPGGWSAQKLPECRR